MRRLPEDPMLRELVRRARGSVVARRSFLAGTAAFGASLALAACAPSGEIAASKTAGDRSSELKALAWQNWPRFLDQKPGLLYPTLATFRSSAGIDVDYHPTIEGDDAYYAEVKNQLAQGSGIGADAVTLTDWMANRWIGLGYAQRLDRSAIPNLANLSSGSTVSAYDPKHDYSVPWNSGFTGLAWNSDALPSGLFEVADLWDSSLKGRVGVLSDMRDTLGLIMLSYGTDISSHAWGDAEFGRAIDALGKYVRNGQIASIKGSDYLDDLRTGKTVATMAWSGDVAALNAQAGRKKFVFGLPGSGGVAWSTGTIVPIASQERANVERLLNYYLEPEVAATVASYTNYAPPVERARAAMEKIAPELVESTSMFPDAKTLSRVKRFRALSSAEQSRYLVEFQGLLLAG